MEVQQIWLLRSWLQSEQCVVKFKIEHYFDEILCDIMPGDCFCILLGRPLQYDKHVVDDVILNQYTIWVDGIKNALFPLIEV